VSGVGRRIREPPFWRGSLPSGVADGDAQIGVICARMPRGRQAQLTLGRADERPRITRARAR